MKAEYNFEINATWLKNFFIINSMKCRICHVVGGVVGGGVEQVIINYCTKISDIDFDLVYQYEPNQECLKKFERLGFHCVRIPEKTKHPIRHIIALYTLFKKGNYDAVHCHLDWYLNWIVCLCALLAGVKKRISHHHHAYLEKTIFHRYLFKIFQFLNRLLATHYLACSYQAAINGWGRKSVESGKVIVINNAIDLQQFQYDEQKRIAIRNMLNIHDEICIGHIGRFCYQKNQDSLLDIFKSIHEQENNTVLLMVGDGPDKARIVKRAETMELIKSIRFVGSQENVSPYYSAMDVFCLPSRWEGLGMVLVEAQVNGLYCIASKEIPKQVKISDGFTFLNIKEPDLWVKNILQKNYLLHDNKADAKQFDIDLMYKKLENLYLS